MKKNLENGNWLKEGNTWRIRKPEELFALIELERCSVVHLNTKISWLGHVERLEET